MTRRVGKTNERPGRHPEQTVENWLLLGGNGAGMHVFFLWHNQDENVKKLAVN